MADPIEVRAGALLRSLIERRGTSTAAVGEAVGLAEDEVERLLAGAGRLDLARVERVLGHLGESPATFFATLYAGTAEPASSAPSAAPATNGPRPSPAPEDPVPREEVEALLRELRSMIDGMMRVLDAKQLLDKD